MKATEFVKKFGVSEARFYLGTAAEGAKRMSFDMLEHGLKDVTLLVSDLKQIVDAWELVERHGGLKEAKKYSSYIADISWTIHKKIEKAINLVEQCNA